MDANTPPIKDEVPDKTRRGLTLSAKIIFYIAIPLLVFIDAAGVLGGLGLPIMLAAAAMNVLLALEVERSVPGILLLLLVNLLPGIAVAVTSVSLIGFVNSLFVLALSLPIWLTVRRGLGRTASIALGAIFATALWCVSFALTVISEKGALSAASVTEVLDAIFSPIGQALSEMSYEEGDNIKKIFNSSDISLMGYYFKSVLIGSVAAVMVVWAYLTTLMTRLIASAFGVAWRLPCSGRVYVRARITEDGPTLDVLHEPVLWRIDIDGVSVGVYIFSYIAVLLFGGGEGGMLILHTVVMNMFIMLSPGFLYCAVRELALGARGKTRGKLKIAPLIIGAVLLLINPVSALFILCAFGVIVVIRDNKIRRRGAGKGKE